MTRIVLGLLLVASLAQTQEQRSYIYDQSGLAIPAPVAFVVADVIDFAHMSVGALREPQDIFVDRNGWVYVADTENNRIVILDAEHEIERVIAGPQVGKPSAVHVDSHGAIYAADLRSNSIRAFSPDGTLLREIPPPRSEVLPEGFLYSPLKLAVDQRGWIYVVGQGTALGIIQLDETGAFRGFFGANPTEFNLLRRLRRLIATEEYNRTLWMQSLIPATDLSISDDGFVYTVTNNLPSEQLKKMNALGVNTYAEGYYGEPIPLITSDRGRFVSQFSEGSGQGRWGRTIDQVEILTVRDPHLQSVDVDSFGVVTVLDGLENRIFQYDAEGNLLFIFGGDGAVEGSFRRAEAVAVNRTTRLVYVLDRSNGIVQVLRPTEYARQVYAATAVYTAGEYVESLRLWESVLDRNANYPTANRGVAMALLKLGRKYGDPRVLHASMRYFRFAQDAEGYSEAFEERRKLYLQDNLGWILLAALAALIGIWAITRYVPSQYARGGRLIGAVAAYFWWAAAHPVRIGEEVKHRWGTAHLITTAAILLLYSGVRTLELHATGYHFTTWDPSRIRLLTELSRVLLPWATWCIANYLITSLFAGEGRLKQVIAFSAYGFVPLIIGTPILVFISRTASLDQAALYNAVRVGMYGWAAIIVLIGVMVVHDYRLRTALLLSLLSIITIVLLWGVVVLLYGLVGSVLGFVSQLIQEVRIRA